MSTAEDAAAVRQPLTRPRIMQAALDLVDRDGLEALTMRRVAAGLGVEAMSLYHHVPNKEAILDGVLDLVVATADLPTGDVTAAEWIRGTAEAFRRLALNHPRVFPLLTSRPIPVADPAAAAPLEAGLAAFAKLGLSPATGYAAMQAVLVSFLSLGLLESQVVNAPHPGATSRIELSPDDFPLVSAVPHLDLDGGLIWSSLIEALVRGLAEPGSR
jgi:TetR/AcrR family tetracycline transcriptional repressor